MDRKTPKYCRVCGKELLNVDWFSHFDVYSGDQEQLLCCPEYAKWYEEYLKGVNPEDNKFLEGNRHSYYTPNDLRDLEEGIETMKLDSLINN